MIPVEQFQLYHFGTALIFILIFYISWSLIKNRKLPPGPWGYPIIGTLPRFDLSRISTFRNLWKQYGDLYTLQFGNRTVVMVNGYNTLREMLLKHGDDTLDRPSNYSFDVLLEKSGTFHLVVVNVLFSKASAH